MSETKDSYGKMTLRAFVLGLVMAGAFAWFTVLRENRPPLYALTATNIPVLPYALLVVTVLLVNPLARLLRVVRAFSRAEILVIFLMGLVSNGIVSYGVTSQLIPMLPGLSSPRFNHSGVKWDVYVQPYMNEDFFIESPGTRAAAIRLRDADAALGDARSALKAAQDVAVCRDNLERARQDLAALGAAQEAAGTTRQAYERKVRIAQRQLQQAESTWQPFAARYDPALVLATFEDKVAALDTERKARKEELMAISKPAFDFVAEYEKGFSEEKRAIPGFVYLPGEGWESYASRVQRLRVGRRARRDLEQALAAAAGTAIADPAALDAALARAIAGLERIADPARFLNRKAAITARLEQIERERAGRQKELTALEEKGWYARDRDIAAIEARIKAMKEDVSGLEKSAARLSEEIKTKVDPSLVVCERVTATLEAVRAVRAEAPSATAAALPAFRDRLRAAMAAFPAFDASLRRFLAGDIAWGVWARPLINWGLIILATYVILLSLNVLIFRQWAHNEKLIYPLAELPLIIAGADTPEQHGALPPVFRSGLFWTGFAISATILAWNHLAEAKLIPNVNPIALDYSWTAYVDGSVFNALRETRFKIIFSVIGLTFLVPTRVSYSMWFWQVIVMLELLVMVWMGLGQSRSSFPYHYTYLMNYQIAQGGGALLVFATVIFWKCRRYLLSAFMPRAVAGLDPAEQRELRISSALFLGASLALIGMFTLRLNVNVFYTVLFYLLLLVLSIGIVRAVAEGGVLGTQVFFNPFHVVRHVFGFDKAWTSPALMAPFWIYVAMMFVDIKSFIAPAMASAIKIRDDLRISRLKFHGAVWASILAAMFVGVAVHVILAYAGGIGRMSGWHYQGGVVDQMGFGFLQRMMEERATDVAGARWWLLAGAAAMVLVLLLRQQFSWILHPIGLIMCINPVMMSLFWGSMFIGWCLKALVSKYGNRDTYQRLRYLAVGLIVGDLALAALGWYRYDFW